MSGGHRIWACAVWLHKSLGVFSAATVNHNNVEKWLSQVNGRREVGLAKRGAGGPEVSGRCGEPAGLAHTAQADAAPARCRAYTPREEARFIDAAALPGFENPEGRRWVVGASIGAGLNGPELQGVGPTRRPERRVLQSK